MISKVNRKKPYQVVVATKDKDGNRKRYCKSFATYAEAKKAESERILEHSHEEDGSVSIETLCTLFLQKRKEEIKITTIDAYSRFFDGYAIPFFKGMDRRKLEKKDFEEWKDFVQSFGNSLSDNKNKYKRLHALFSFAFKEYGRETLKYLDRAGNFKRNPNEVPEEEELHFWDQYQFKIFIDVLRKKCEAVSEFSADYMPYWGCYVRLNILFFAGLRKGEANALTPADFIQRRGTYYLNITKSCSHKVRGMDWVTVPPKNKTSVRCVPLPNALVDIIKEHLYTRLNRLGSQPLYLCGGLKHISDSTLDKLKDDTEKEAGVPHIRVHDLRHSYVSVLINANTPITTISKLVGHSTPDITWKVYSHIYPDALSSAVSAFDTSVCGKPIEENSSDLWGNLCGKTGKSH